MAQKSITKGITILDKLYKIVEALNNKFPDGNEPFLIMTRLLEECGELAAEVNHREGQGVKQEKHGIADKGAMAKEVQDVLRAVLSLVKYYEMESDLHKSIDLYYERVVNEGLVHPLSD